MTVEPTRSGGSIVVPIGDGLDYEVREAPKTVLEMLEGAPQVKVVPVPPPKTLTPMPDDVSPEVNPREEDAPPRDESAAEPQKKTRKTKAASKKKTSATDKAVETDEPVKRKRTPSAKKRPEKSSLPSDFQKIVDGLKARKCRTVKRMRNAIQSDYRKMDSGEIDMIIEGMIDGGYIVVETDGHVNWTGALE